MFIPPTWSLLDWTLAPYDLLGGAQALGGVMKTKTSYAEELRVAHIKNQTLASFM